VGAGSATGNTTYWDGTQWVLNSSNIYNAGANIGIGTTSPTYKLSVQTATANYGIMHTDGTYNIASWVGSSGGNAGGWIGTVSSNPLFFFTAGGSPQVTLNTSGNLGVGTVSPNERTEVNGNIALSKGANRKLYIVNETSMNNTGGFDLTLKASDHSSNSWAVSGGALYLQAGNGYNPGTGSVGGGNVYIQSGANTTSANSGYRNGGDIIFQTGSSYSTYVEQMRITETGYVGIGTSSPSYDLDVAGDINLTGAIRAAGSAGTSGQVLSTTGSGISWTTVNSSPSLTSTSVTATNGSTTNNLNIGSATYIKVSGPTSAFTITGLTGGTDGKMIILYNTSSGNMTLKNQSTSSTAANRVITTTGADVTTTGDGSITMLYDGTQSRWIVVNVQQ
jgi:hypothetical protein